MPKKEIITLAQAKNIEYIDYNTFGKIILTLDQETKETPKLEVLIGQE